MVTSWIGSYYALYPGLLTPVFDEKWWSEHETERYHCYGPNNVRRLCCPREHNKKELGTCPTTVPSALSKATAFRSWGFPASCRTCTISSVLGVHVPLKIWWPRITLSWRKIESSDTGALVISVLVIVQRSRSISIIYRTRGGPTGSKGHKWNDHVPVQA